MPHDPSTIANSLLEIARLHGQQLDPMKLQKLVYFSHGWHLGFGLGPLSSETAEAWQWGPVFPSLYHAVKGWGSGPVLESILVLRRELVKGQPQYLRTTPTIPAEESVALQLLNRIWQVYGHMTALELSQLSHEPDGPWARARAERRRGAVISDSSIREYFGAKIEANAGS